MVISFEIPEAIERAVQAELDGDVARFAREALAIELYRRGKITIGIMAELLGIERIDAYGWLKIRGVAMNYDIDDLNADRETLAKFFGDSGPAARS